MRLRLIREGIGRTITVYKWMAGSDWYVHTREGEKTIGDSIIPLWVGMDLDIMPMFFSLVYNNLDNEDQIYLVTIECAIEDHNATIDKPYITYEYDKTQEHEIGSKAYQLGAEESLIMAPATISIMQLAIPNEAHDSITLIDQRGNKSMILI